MVHLARLTGLDDEAGLHAQSLADQAVVDSGRGERRRYGDPIGGGGAIGDDQDVHVRQDLVRGVGAQPVERTLQPGVALDRGPGGVEGRGAESAVDKFRDRPDLLEITVGQHRLGDFQALVRARAAPEHVGSRADHRDQAHHQLFPDRVDRWIGDLREVLLEVVVKKFRALGEHRDGRVRAHRPDGVLAGPAHGLEEEAGVFLCEAEGLLAVEQRVRHWTRRRLPQRWIGQFLQLDLSLLEPVGIWLGGAQGPP